MLKLEDFLAGEGGAVETLAATLARAIEDIPHVGRFCKNKDERGKCVKTGAQCTRQIHTVCPVWEWRGI